VLNIEASLLVAHPDPEKYRAEIRRLEDLLRKGQNQEVGVAIQKKRTMIYAAIDRCAFGKLADVAAKIDMAEMIKV
jgi:hypothetical protein